MDKIIEAILKDCDPDIRRLMLEESDEHSQYRYNAPEVKSKNWELLPCPEQTIVYWQLLRNSK